jgi:hypothetical protein
MTAVVPANGAASGVTPTVKQFGPNLTETQQKQVDTTQQAATVLACDGTTTAVQADENNHVKDSQNYGIGTVAHVVANPGAGTTGSTLGQPSGYSIKGD